MNSQTLVGTLSAIGLTVLLTNTSLSQVYKQVQPDGTVVFTDTPEEDMAAEKIVIPPTSTVPAVSPATANMPEPTNKKITNFKIAIGSPANGLTYRNTSADSIPLDYKILPMNKGYKVKVHLDGESIDPEQPQLPPQYRGTHTLTITLETSIGQILAQASSTFYVHRNSVMLDP